jgi:heat shock protein HslJ
VTLSVDDGRVSGQGPCNGYHGKIELGDDDSVTISKIGATLKSCGDRLDRAEQRFFDALEGVDTIDVSDEELELSNGERLVFEPQ